MIDVDIKERDGAIVVSLEGPAAEVMVERVLHELPSSAGEVVLDLSRLTPMGYGTVTRLVADLSSHGWSVCLVSARLSGRRLLRRWGLFDSASVFRSVDEALALPPADSL